MGEMGERGATAVEARGAPSVRVATEGHPEVIVIDLGAVEPTERSEVLGLVASRVRERLREDDVVEHLGAERLGVTFRGLPPSTIESLQRRIAGALGEPVVTAAGRVRRLDGSVRLLRGEVFAPTGDEGAGVARTSGPAGEQVVRPAPPERPARVAPTPSRDPLTSLLTPRALAVAVSATPPPYVVALIDVDGLGAINACLGLAGGDGVLAQLARLLAESSEHDLVGRWSGQQFLVVMPGATAEGAAARMERLLGRTMAQVRVSVRRVSFCAGIATSIPGEGLDAVVHEAERALRAAKGRGRGTVLVGDERPPQP